MSLFCATAGAPEPHSTAAMIASLRISIFASLTFTRDQNNKRQRGNPFLPAVHVLPTGGAPASRNRRPGWKVEAQDTFFHGEPGSRRILLLKRQRSWVVRSWRVRIWMLLSIIVPAAANAATASAGNVERGSVLFVGNGCGACHTIKGTEAHGTIGPDLSHVGSRMTIGAGL